MVAPENLDLVVQVRVLTGQFKIGRMRTSKGMGKEFSHVFGVTATNVSEERQRGDAPMGSLERKRKATGSRAKPGILTGQFKICRILWAILERLFWRRAAARG